MTDAMDDAPPRRGRYRKGQSGNPGGLSKETVAAREFESEARKQAVAALEMLGKIVADGTQPSAARIAAARAVMERAWGEVKSPADTNPWRKNKKEKIERIRIVTGIRKHDRGAD